MKIRKMKTRALVWALMSFSAVNSFAQWSPTTTSTTPQIGREGQVRIGFLSNTSPIQLEVKSSALNNTLSSGQYTLVGADMAVKDGGGQMQTTVDGQIYSRMVNAGHWGSTSSLFGMVGQIYNLKNLNSLNGTGAAAGGYFNANLNNTSIYGLIGGGFTIAGVQAVMDGSASLELPSSGIGAALVAQDKINTANTWAGYFEGKSYFSSSVGLGTKSPKMKLDVYKGDMIFTGDPNATNTAFRFHHQYWLNNGSLILTPASSSDGSFANTGWEFTYGGEFRSFGKIWAPEVEVKLPPFPDYVFEKDYNLMDINELEKYISSNKHLPGIPSACEIEEKGIGIGALQAKLMEKVEELTLYVIELKKENARMQEQLDNVQQIKSR